MYARPNNVAAKNCPYTKQYRVSSNKFLVINPPWNVQYSARGAFSATQCNLESLSSKQLASSVLSHSTDSVVNSDLSIALI